MAKQPASRSERTVPGADAFVRTAHLLIEKHYYGESKSASLQPVEIKGTDGKALNPEQQAKTKALLGLRKRLLDSPELRQIKYRDKEFRHFLHGVATPFRPGLYLVPAKMVEVVCAEAKKWEQEREALVETAAKAYPAHVQSMRGPLGPLYNPLDYPPVEVFKAKFWISWRFVNFGVSDLIKEARADIIQEETAKLRAQAVEASALIQQHLFVSLNKILEHLKDLLTPSGESKRLGIREGSFDRLTEFLKTVEDRDTTGNPSLKRVITQLRKLGKNLDLDTLREDDTVRAQVTTEMTQIIERVDALVVETTRGIRIRDEEVA